MGQVYSREEHDIIRDAYRQRVPLLEIIGRLFDRTPGGLVQEIRRQARFDKKWDSDNLEFYAAEWRALKNDPKYGYKKRDPNASRKKGGLSYHKKDPDEVNLRIAFEWSDRVRDLGYDLHEIRLLSGSRIRVVPIAYEDEQFEGSDFKTDLTSHLSLAASELKVELDGRVSVKNGGKNYDLVFGLKGLEEEPKRKLMIFLHAYAIALEREVIDEFKD